MGIETYNLGFSLKRRSGLAGQEEQTAACFVSLKTSVAVITKRMEYFIFFFFFLFFFQATKKISSVETIISASLMIPFAPSPNTKIQSHGEYVRLYDMEFF